MSSFDIRVERVVEASPDVAFHHWVDAEARRSWYAPDEGSTVVESETDLRVGGSYTVAVVGPMGDPMYREEGIFEVVDPPHRLVYQQVMRLPDGTSVETRVTVTFEAHEGKTLLTLRDEGYPTEEQRDRFEGGWPAFLDAYEQTVPSGAEQHRRRGR
jgi:uncharacterized protein YndB with AHSA1/START domain